MKIKKSELKQIIQEELGLLDEGVLEWFGQGEKKIVKGIIAQIDEWLQSDPTTATEYNQRKAHISIWDEQFKKNTEEDAMRRSPPNQRYWLPLKSKLKSVKSKVTPQSDISGRRVVPWLQAMDDREAAAATEAWASRAGAIVADARRHTEWLGDQERKDAEHLAAMYASSEQGPEARLRGAEEAAGRKLSDEKRAALMRKISGIASGRGQSTATTQGWTENTDLHGIVLEELEAVLAERIKQ